MLEAGALATVQTRPGVRVVTWEAVRRAGMADKEVVQLLEQLNSGNWVWDPTIQEFKRYAGEMTVVDGVILYQGRVFVASVLLGEVLGALHRGHQGATSMSLRAAETV